MKPQWVRVCLVAMVAGGCGRNPLNPTPAPDGPCPASKSAIGQVANAQPLKKALTLSPRSCDFPATSTGRFETMSALVRLVLGNDDPAHAERFLSQGLDARRVDDRAKVITALLSKDAATALSDAWMSMWLKLPTESPFPQRLNPTLWSDLREQTLQHGRAVFIDASLNLDSFMTSSESFANEVVARHYSIAPPMGTRFELVKLPPERVGVLGHAAVLGSHSTVSRRGVLLQRSFLECAEVPSPPQGLTAHDNPPTTLQARRTIEAEVGSNPACQACHTLVDIGFALGAFDERGQRRQREADGTPINTRTVVSTFAGDQFPINGLSELATAIDQHAKWKTCLAQALFAVASQRLRQNAVRDDTEFCSPAAVLAASLERDANLAEVLPIVATMFFGGTIDLRGPREPTPDLPDPLEPGDPSCTE